MFPRTGKSRVGLRILVKSPRVSMFSNLYPFCGSGCFMLISPPGILLNLKQQVSTPRGSEKGQQRLFLNLLPLPPAAGCFYNGCSIHMQPNSKYLLSFCYFLGIAPVFRDISEDSLTLTAQF